MVDIADRPATHWIERQDRDGKTVRVFNAKIFPGSR
jgi:hypothetical protein